MSVDLQLFVRELMQSVRSEIAQALKTFRPNVENAVGVIGAPNLPRRDPEAAGTVDVPGFLQPARHEEEAAIKPPQSNDPRIVLGGKIYVDNADMDNGWANLGGAEPAFSLVKDRRSVRVRGVIANAAATAAVITALPEAYWPDERSYGILVDLVTYTSFPVMLEPDGELWYTDAGTTDLSAGAYLLMEYRSAS